MGSGTVSHVLSLFGEMFTQADRRIRIGPNCATCCGAGVSWSTSGCRNSTGLTKGSQKAAGPPPNGTYRLDDEIARLDEESLQSSSGGRPFTRLQGVGINCGSLAADLPELGEGDGSD